MAEDAYTERQELAKWKSYNTGARNDYNSIQRDPRGYPLFVRATRLSDEWDQYKHVEGQKGNDSRTVDDDDSSLLDDIFSASYKPRVVEQVSTSDEVIEYLPKADDPNRGESVASFYSSLPRESTANIDSSIIAQHNASRPYRRIYSATPLKRDGTTDWFIRKASSKLRDEEIKDKEMKAASIVEMGEGSSSTCSVCLASLPYPLLQKQWESHRSSIAHQVAADGPIQAGPSRKREPSKRKEHDEGARVVLKPSNIGYITLQKMGWRKGMGLGKEEWDHCRQRFVRKAGSEPESVIVISDSDDGEDDRHLEIGSELWLDSIRRGQARLELSQPKGSSKDEMQIDDTQKQDQIVAHQRPLLEPISIQLRPDRRGIGKYLPKLSRIADDRNHKIEKHSSKIKTRPLTKSERRAMYKQEKEEWKQLRSSLN